MTFPTTAGRALAAALALAAPPAFVAPAYADELVEAAAPLPVDQAPRVVLISLDGAEPGLIRQLVRDGVLPRDGGLARLMRDGVFAKQNITATPSLTAVSHIAIATGSTAVNNDIPANSFHAVAAPIATGISGFAAPIGGYELFPLGPESRPTAEPLWVRLRREGRTVVAATWPGADGADIRINNVVVQSAIPTRVTDYAVPFGAFGGIGATGFTLTAANFAPDPAIAAQIEAAGHVSFSPILATTAPFETFTCASATTATCTTSTTTPLDLTFQMRAAALDSTDNGTTDYDTLAIFEATQGITSGPFEAPSTGPAYVLAGDQSELFFFEGTGNVIGSAYYVSSMAPDLSVVRFARYSANFIPRNAPVIEAVDDINRHVGFWRPQPDFRIPERLSPGFTAFPDVELEAMYEDQVRSFVRYQTQVSLRAIRHNPGVDLVMIYIEEPDGSGHQFTLTDPRQATDFRDPNSIHRNQDFDKIERYADYLEFAYRRADWAVGRILDTVGPSSNVIVVSDHGMTPFHTAVNMANVLRNAGVDITRLGIRTNGPAVNIYVNLEGRESGGTVDGTDYQALVDQVATALREARDPNVVFNFSLRGGRIFDTVIARPELCPEGPGLCTNRKIGQDFGDVFAMLAEGYNFDGTQNPVVVRLGDPAFDPLTTMFSVPNFYGAHGYDPALPSMSASFIAAGPDILRGTTLDRVTNIDVAPTVLRLLGVEPTRTMDGRVLEEILN
jgi:predicted AlkP superfamily phosphohydrolase/phosphomutase